MFIHVPKAIPLLEIEREISDLQALRNSHSHFYRTTVTDLVTPVGTSCASGERSKNCYKHMLPKPLLLLEDKREIRKMLAQRDS